MNLNDAQETAEWLINKLNLSGWKIRWMSRKATRVFGECYPRQKLIRLSPVLTEMNNDDVVLNTILHELAHALDFTRFKIIGHGKTWKKICDEIGCDGVTRYKTECNGGKVKMPPKTIIYK